MDKPMLPREALAGSDTRTSAPSAVACERAEHRVDQLLAAATRSPSRSERRRLRQEAVILTLDLADSLSRRYRGRDVDPDDLVQVARMALVKAVWRYRPELGTTFVAYAVPTILGELRRHFRDHAWAVRPTRRLQEVRAQVARAEEELVHAKHRTPTGEELAQALGLSTHEVREAQLCAGAYNALSLDLPSTGSSRSPAEMLPADGDDFDALVTRHALAAAIAGLSESERLLIWLRFVAELTQSEIGAVLGVSQMEVSRMIRRLLRRLREQLLSDTRAA